MSKSGSGRSRFRVLERNIELELEPLDIRDAIGLTLIFASLCVVSCGSVLFYGSDWLHRYDPIGWTGVALILGGGGAFALTAWLMEPHKAARHASHRLRHHARTLRSRKVQAGPAMSDAEFNALEDEVDHFSSDHPR